MSDKPIISHPNPNTVDIKLVQQIIERSNQKAKEREDVVSKEK